MTQKAYIRHSEQLISLIFFVKTYHKKSKACLDTYAAIARYWNPQGNIFPNQETLAALVGVQTRTIRTHISQLKKLKLLDFHQPNEKGKPPRSNQYTFITDTLKKWVDEAKKERNTFNKALREEKRALQEAAEQQEREKISDPTPPKKYDPPITSSLHSEDINNKITGNFVPTILDCIFRNAHISEDNHRTKLVIESAKRRRQERLNRFLEPKPKTPEEIQRIEAIKKRNQEVMDTQSKLDRLEGALSAWITTGKGFTNQMLDELYQLRNNRLNPMMELFASKFKKAQLSG
ncbi:helix-turn-helix domain-containing protein [Vibrio europaeus]|uniref:helix-turn-helix domain-containing protein n=1 Tax=Vibrio europaeus TaxID=300876 RepID=UPI00233ED84B|nr:helix-turn-helix domain-containing protein [Vibrio europaeus]MDC5753538.1 helix-turn-helix domain-containing protein [Vibrio europaeus]MDC5816549.1 helix-turn-helix domain-containing protein [Vibrio europaeus]